MEWIDGWRERIEQTFFSTLVLPRENSSDLLALHPGKHFQRLPRFLLSEETLSRQSRSVARCPHGTKRGLSRVEGEMRRGGTPE